MAATKKVALIFFAAAASMVLVSLLSFRSRAEPSYQDKPLKHWLLRLDPLRAGDRKSLEAETALRAMWPAALPFLMEYIQKETGFDVGYRKFHSARPAKLRSWLPKPKRPVCGSFVTRSMLALGLMGSEAEDALPHLKVWLNDPRAYARIAAAISVWRISQERDLVLPVLLAHLQDGQVDYLDAQVLLALTEMGPGAKAAVPAIQDYLGLPALLNKDRWETKKRARLALLNIQGAISMSGL